MWQTPGGLYDMHGNVLEWCQDWCDEDYYRESPASDPRGPTQGVGRVPRGGSWYNPAEHGRSAFRVRYVPENRNYNLGFRVARSPSGKQSQHKQGRSQGGVDARGETVCGIAVIRF